MNEHRRPIPVHVVKMPPNTEIYEEYIFGFIKFYDLIDKDEFIDNHTKMHILQGMYKVTEAMDTVIGDSAIFGKKLKCLTTKHRKKWYDF